MRITILFLIFVACSSQSVLQQYEMESTEMGGNYIWWDYKNLDQYFNLPDIEKSSYDQHIRIHLIDQIIDLYSSNCDMFYGDLTNIIAQYGSGNQNNSDWIQHIYKTISIDSLKSTFLANFLMNESYYLIPTDTLLDGWNDKRFLHCGNLVIEYKIENKYNLKNYTCPWEQDETAELKETILNIDITLENELSLKKEYEQFMTKLPKGTYSRNGYLFLLKE